MIEQQKIIKNKLGLLNLARELGNSPNSNITVISPILTIQH